MRLHHRVLFASVGLAALAGCRAFFELPEIGDSTIDASVEPPSGGTDASVPRPDASVVDASENDASDAGPLLPDAAPSCPLYIPPEGDYVYEPESSAQPGREAVFFLDESGAEPENPGLQWEVPARGQSEIIGAVRHAPGGWTLGFVFAPEHSDSFKFIASRERGLQVAEVTEYVSVATVVATCDPPVDVIRCPMVPAVPWVGAASGTFSTGAPQLDRFDASLTFLNVDSGLEDMLPIAGVLVPTFHITDTRRLRGKVAGTMNYDYWFAKSNGLLILARFRIGNLTSKVVDGVTMSINGVPAEYKGSGGFKLTSLTPRPVPDAGAPRGDAGTRAQADGPADGLRAASGGERP